MSETRTCPKCRSRMAFTHRHDKGGGLIVKYRKCACGHADSIYLREVVVRIVETAKRHRLRTNKQDAA